MNRALSLRAARLLLSLLLALAAVVLGGLSFHRKVQSFQPLGFEAVRQGGAAVVQAVQDSGTGLRPGDQVLLAGNVEAAAPGLRERLAAATETELVVLRGDQLVEVEYRRPPLDVDVPYLVIAAIGVVYLLIGLYTLARHKGRQSFLFYLWCLGSALVYLLSPVPPFAGVERAIYLVETLALIALAPITLHLFLTFPEPVARNRWLGRVVPFLYLPAAVLAALEIDLVTTSGRFLFRGDLSEASVLLLSRLELYHLVLFGLAAVAVLVRRLTRDRGWEEHRQAAWMAWGLAGGYLPFVALYVVPLAVGVDWPEAVRAAAAAPLAAVPLTFAWAILRYKLWDIEVVVRDAISSTLTLLLGIASFSLVNLAIDRGLPEGSTLARSLLAFVGGLAIAGLLVPTRRGVSSVLERVQYRGVFGKRRALTELGRELLHERDLGRLALALLRRLEEAVELDHVNLLLAQGQDLIAFRPEPGLPVRLPLAELDHAWWGSEIVRLSGFGDPTAPPPLSQDLFLAGYRYAFPLTLRGTRLGVVLTGHKVDSTPLNSEDVELVRQLLNQAALAIENATLMGQLQHQLDQVVRLQQYSEGIFESSPAGIAVLEPDGRVRSVNRAFAGLAGRERHELTGRFLAEVLPVEPLPMPGEGPVEVAWCDREGRERYLQLSLADVEEGATGRRRILVAYDVSERVAMENALREKDRLAALGMLAAGVAHEVNTPITGISSYAQMLLSDTPESDPRHEILKKVERQTFRAARIVNNLLEFARDRRRRQGTGLAARPCSRRRRSCCASASSAAASRSPGSGPPSRSWCSAATASCSRCSRTSWSTPSTPWPRPAAGWGSRSRPSRSGCGWRSRTPARASTRRSSSRSSSPSTRRSCPRRHRARPVDQLRYRQASRRRARRREPAGRGRLLHRRAAARTSPRPYA